jgi:hypothetical protein
VLKILAYCIIAWGSLSAWLLFLLAAFWLDDYAVTIIKNQKLLLSAKGLISFIFLVAAVFVGGAAALLVNSLK